MTIRVRKASTEVTGQYKVPSYAGRMAQPALALQNGRTCDGCRWGDRCRQDGWCWAAEKLAIAAEKP